MGSWCDRTSVLIRHQRALSLPSSTCTQRRGRWAHSKMAATRQPREESPEWKLPCRHLKLGRPASRTVGNKRLLGKRPQSMVFYHAATAGKHTRQATTCGSPCKLNPTLTGLRLFNKMSLLVACLNVAATSHNLGGSRTLTLRFCASLTVDLWTYASLQTTFQPALDYLVFLWLVFKNATFSLNRTWNKGMTFKHVRNQIYAVGWEEWQRRSGFYRVISRRDPLRHCIIQVLENEHHPVLFITPLEFCFSLALPSISVMIATEHVTIRLQTHSGSISSSIDNTCPILTKQMPSRDWLRRMSPLAPVILSLRGGASGPDAEMLNFLMAIAEVFDGIEFTLLVFILSHYWFVWLVFPVN